MESKIKDEGMEVIESDDLLLEADDILVSEDEVSELYMREHQDVGH